MALTIVTWLWGEKYSGEDVRKLYAGVRRNLKQEHRFVVISDREVGIVGASWFPIAIADRPLLQIPGCFVRLRLFDPLFQRIIGADERIVCMDLDSIVTGPLDELFDRPDSFAILQGANISNPCPYNGSLWMLRAGYRPDVWINFDIRERAKIPQYQFPDDQGWFALTLPNAAGWKCGDKVWAFGKTNWPRDNRLPKDARLIVFPGYRAPAQFTHIDWVQRHWQ